MTRLTRRPLLARSPSAGRSSRSPSPPPRPPRSTSAEHKGTFCEGGLGTPPCEPTLHSPAALAVDQAGAVYVGDNYTHR